MPEYPRRLPHFSYTGFNRYSLRFSTFERNAYFRDESRVELTRTQILRACDQQWLALLAYCFMPDHVHLLVEGTREDADLKTFILRAKQFSGYHYKQAFKQNLWQRYGYERVLRQEEATADVVKYIINNPVRAGLVSDPSDYPYWGSGICSREQLLEYISAATERAS